MIHHVLQLPYYRYATTTTTAATTTASYIRRRYCRYLNCNIIIRYCYNTDNRLSQLSYDMTLPKFQYHHLHQYPTALRHNRKTIDYQKLYHQQQLPNNAFYCVHKMMSTNTNTNPNTYQEKDVNNHKQEQQQQQRTATALETLQKHTELDFFGEPITFLCDEEDTKHQMDEATKTNVHKIRSNSIASMDAFLLCAITKGKTCIGGGDEGGLETRSAHSTAITWTEALIHAMIWNQQEQQKHSNRHTRDDNDNNNQTTKSSSKKYYLSNASTMISPMLAVVAVAPLLVNTGIAYVKHIDTLLYQTKSRIPGLIPIQMMDMVHHAIQYRDETSIFHDRECLHFQAVYYLLQNQYETALYTYMKLLHSCPGDALAISLAMDLSQTLGDKSASLRITGSIASYWNERRGGIVRPAIPGHAIVSSLMALGLAVAGRDDDAEQMAERSMNIGKNVCGALATWAQVHVFDARGRIAEGISACANFDGIRNYEGAGFLFFDCRLSGYGARFSLDREERGRGKSAALRLYEGNFARVLNYSGFSQGQLWLHPLYRAPISWAERKTLEGKSEPTPSLFDRIFGRTMKKEDDDLNYELVVKRVTTPSTQYDGFEPSCEDVLTWLPPTPALLSDATLLLLRFTFNGTISPRNARWDNIRNAWTAMLDIQKRHGDDSKLKFNPLVCVTASILFPPAMTGGDQIGSGRLAEGLYSMGELLNLGNPVTDHEKTTAVKELVADHDPNFWLPVKSGPQQEWKKIVDHLSSALNGLDYPNEGNDKMENLVDTSRRFRSWDFEARPIFEHAICFAACKAGDIESLCLARAICSQGVTLRPNAPEEWWRYSIVLGLLGDDVGSENAWNNSINFGSGQGGRS